MYEYDKIYQMNTLIQKHSSRNSLLEVYRFIFAIWVMYHHGYFFVPKGTYFFNGYISVEFFFILSGFFLIKSIKKESENSFWKGLWNLTWKRLRPLGITIIISLIFAQIYFWYFFPNSGDPVGYMWFMKWLIFVPIIFYAFYRLIKNKKVFYSLLGITVVVCHILQYTVLEGAGILRGVVGIGIGVLLSLIPKNKLKLKNFNVNIIFTILFITATFLVAFFGIFITGVDHYFIWLLFPGLVYFAYCVDCKIKILYILGDLSFGVYAYQAIPRFFERLGIWHSNIKMCLVVFAFALIDYGVRILIDYYKQKRITNGECTADST